MRRAAMIFVTLVGCSSSSPSPGGSPNKTPGQCVLSQGIWYCGAGYGNWPDCETWDAGAKCSTTKGCFWCSEGAGATCSCWPGDAGNCLPTETGCSQ